MFSSWLITIVDVCYVRSSKRCASYLEKGTIHLRETNAGAEPYVQLSE
ncbi:hypothetical protein DAPPPG734_11530 [Pantoea agglomerans]|uniref:Uncharacterized protein n=1 Tax=Enterobacter agglomerans TaxID=549 RepID=A0AAN2FCX7_ENTAG|nr:hypothetical protein DAPPPG734_11530 [Pantoea agglomerans]